MSKKGHLPPWVTVANNRGTCTIADFKDTTLDGVYYVYTGEDWIVHFHLPSAYVTSMVESKNIHHTLTEARIHAIRCLLINNDPTIHLLAEVYDID